MAGEQQFKVFLSFKDEATGKFIEATDDQIAAMKKLGIVLKKEGAGVGVAMDKMAQEAEKSKRSMRFLGGEITGVMKSLGSLRNMILVYLFALRPLVALVKESAEAYAQQEDAIKRINYAMGLQGTYSKEMSDDLIKLSKGFQSVTRYGDEAVLEVMEKLITIGSIMPTQLERVTQATLDLASATGRDLGSAAEILAKASQGITRGLAQVGIVIDKNLPKTKVLEEVLRFIEEHMGKRAQADVESYAGKIAQAANALNDLQESIGKLMAEGLNLPVVLGWWKVAFEGLNKAITGEGVTILDTLQKQLAEINKAIAAGGAETIAKGKPRAWWGFGGYAESEIKKAQDLLIQRDQITRAIQFENQIQANQKMLAEQKVAETKLAQEKLAIQETFEEQYLSYQRSKASFRLGELKKDYDTYKVAFQGNAEALLEVDQWYKYQKETLDLALLQEAKKHSDMYVMFMQGAARGMKEALVDGFIKIARGEFEGLMGVVSNFGSMMLEVIMQMAAVKIIKATFLGAFLGAHTGGYMYPGIESSYGYRKRFHSGGEVPATLLEGEGILSRVGMRSLGVDNLNKLNRGERMGGGTTINNYYIQTIDERSFRERLQEHGDIYAGASEMGIKDNTSLRKTSQQFG